MSRPTRALLIALDVLILLGLYLYGASVQYRRNDDMDRTDQKAYMRYARELREEGLSYSGDRNRMPLYPLVMSPLYYEDMEREDQFAVGKVGNVVISLIVLAAMWPLFRRHLSIHGAINLMLIVAFTVFVFRSAYFQCELLFYGLNMLAYWLLSRILVRPRWPLALAAGVVLALTHLTKASIMPGIAAYVACAAAQSVWRLWQARRGAAGEPRRALLKPALLAVVVVILFVAVLSPYLLTSKRLFGRYFYNVNSTFYVWYDSWAQAKEGTRAHGDREGWPDMPAEQIPSAGKYLREHTVRQIAQRVGSGVVAVYQRAARSYGYHRYALGYLAVALLLIALRWRHAWEAFRASPFLAAFWACWLVGYLLLYGFYVPITQGPRLALAQFMPLMWSCAIVIEKLAPSVRAWRVSGREITLQAALHWVVTAAVLLDLYLIMTYRITALRGAS